MNFNRLFLLSAVLVALVAVTSLTAIEPQEQKVIFVVRHAEKEKSGGQDPDLTEAGRQRASLLSSMLRSTPLSAVYATQFARTKQTVAPTARSKGLDVTILDARKTGELANRIRSDASPNGALVAGHSNTVPAPLAALGVNETEIPRINEGDYDNLFMVILGDDPPRLVRLHFGP